MKEIRQPPKPSFWESPSGTCRMCGEVILTKDGGPDRRRRFHEPCGIAWRIASRPDYARMALFVRDRGICRDCGEDRTVYQTAHRTTVLDVGRLVAECEKTLPISNVSSAPFLGKWEVDHDYPLWLVDRTAPDALRYWGLDNLKTRCPSCHDGKTSREAAHRAKSKRIHAKASGTWRPKRKKLPKGRALQGRGFDKTKTRTFAGKARDRSGPAVMR